MSSIGGFLDALIDQQFFMAGLFGADVPRVRHGMRLLQCRAANLHGRTGQMRNYGLNNRLQNHLRNLI